MPQGIIKTIYWFDLFNYPLTPRELWRYSPVKQSFKEVLAQLPTNGLASQDGFYCLPARQEIIISRHERYNIADQKFKRALKAAWWFGRLPWIKLVALANQIGAHNMRAAGDLDFFIVTSPRRLWLARFFLNSVLTVLNLRPTSRKSNNTLCLSFWVASDNLDLSNYRLARDPYFRYWLAGLTPLLNRDATYEKLIAANGWLTQELPNWQPLTTLPRRNLKATTKRAPHNIFNFLENWAKKFQLAILPRALKAAANQDTRVVINDNVFKAHLTDRRQEFLDKFQSNLEKLT